MDLKVFMPKTPVSLSAQLHRDVTNKEYTGITLSSGDSKHRRYFVAGFSVSELEGLGISDSTQLSQLRSMDDAGSIDLVTFESDPDNLGFILTEDLHSIIGNARDDLGILNKANWSIFEIVDPLSETPFEGSLSPLTNSKGEAYHVPFEHLLDYFEHVVTTGELLPDMYKEGDRTTMADSNNKGSDLSNEELRQLLADRSGEGASMDMSIEEKKSMDDILFEDGDEYFQQHLAREREEQRRQEEEARRQQELERQRVREAEARRQQQIANQRKAGGQQSGDVFIPNLKSFDDILQDLNVSSDSDIQRFYMSDLETLHEYTDSMNIEASVFNAFDAEGRRDLMIAMNREREKLVNQALIQLKREAIAAEEQVAVDSDTANVSVREKHIELYVTPLEERQEAMRIQLEEFEKETNSAFDNGFNEWWEAVQEDPMGAYREIFEQSQVTDIVNAEKERLSNEYSDFRNNRQYDLDVFIADFVEKRKDKDLYNLRLDWSEGARLGAQTLSDRVDSTRSQMENRRMMQQMREMYSQFEERANSRGNSSAGSNDPQVSRPSQTSRPSGTIQQENPSPKVQGANLSDRSVEAPSVESPVVSPPVKEEAKEELIEEKVIEDDLEANLPEEVVVEKPVEEVVPEPTPAPPVQAPVVEAPQPVISRPGDMYAAQTPSAPEDTWDDLDDDSASWDDDLLDDTEDWDMDDDDDFGEDWDDDELDDFEVDDKPRKKGLRGLFGKR